MADPNEEVSKPRSRRFPVSRRSMEPEPVVAAKREVLSFYRSLCDDQRTRRLIVRQPYRSALPGVKYDSRRSLRKWFVQLTGNNGKRKFWGIFESKEEAEWVALSGTLFLREQEEEKEEEAASKQSRGQKKN